jgi:CMP-N-acetylneuraminic acid synthetase
MYKKKKVLCVIPARGGSKGIPLKNIITLCGKPLLHYALQAVLKSKMADRIVVSSDHPDILAVAARYGKNLPQKRPRHLSGDIVSSREVLEYALKQCEKDDNCQYPVIILVQATNPLVLSQDIDDVIKKMVDTKCDSCVTVTGLGHLHPAKFKKLKGDRLLPYIEEEGEIKPRQKVKEVFIRNGSCYAVRREVLLKKSLVGKVVRAVKVPRERHVDINDPLDLMFAEFLLKLNKGK